MSGSGILSPTAKKANDLKSAELSKVKERLLKVEKLLSENLETMDYQQKQYEAEIEILNDSKFGM